MVDDVEGESRGASTSRQLIDKARAGDSRAVGELFHRHRRVLTLWARGRLPRWARSVSDTADMVQDVLLNTFRRLDRFENRGKGALRAYLRQAVMNRINDEKRRVMRPPTGELEEGVFDLPETGPTPFDATADAERQRRYKTALASLSEDERVLIVGRMELGYTYEQLALIAGRATPEAARVAVRRAVVKLAERLPDV
jgi:RNA polymerase sigma-70 factor (ECF subfamily)